MKRKMRKHLLNGLSVAMAVCLGGGFFATELGEPYKKSTSVHAAAAGKLTDVTGKYNTHATRENYFDDSVVMKNSLSADDERWVIVEFEEDSVMQQYENVSSHLDFDEYAATSEAQKLTAKLEKEHKSFMKQLKVQGIDYEYKYSYSLLNNGLALKVRRGDIATIQAMDGVVGLQISENYAYPKAAVNVSNNANVYSTGIYNSSEVKEKGIDGTGMVVAVLDSGLDKTHPAFQTMPDEATLGLTAEQVEAALPGLEASKLVSSKIEIDQVYYNHKIPYAFDYADCDTDVYPSYSSHGTHVSGIIVGKDDDKQVNVDDPTERFVGVAPNAQLAFFDVFTDDPENEMLGGADTVDILAALTDCVRLGVDVINMSLGSSSGFTDEGDRKEGDYLLKEVYDNIHAAGISLVVAASNDASSGFGGGNGTNLASNPDSATVGSPSTYAAALSVASINGKEDRYMLGNAVGDNGEVAFINNSSDVNGNEIDFMDELYKKYLTETPEGQSQTYAELYPEKMVDNKLTLNYLVVKGVGRTQNFTSTIKNAIKKDPTTLVLVRRGDITFKEKIENAMAAGAFGCIVYNNVSGIIRMSLGEIEDPIPSCSISMDAGNLLAEHTKNGSITFSYDYKAGPFMSSFSSWGPTPDLKLKPEITAHGGDILSAVPGGGYEEQSGTSMATPNMAGAVALLRQHIEKTGEFNHLSGVEKTKAITARVNQLLMSTATIAKNDEGNPYSPRKQGAGLASILKATTAEGYITVKNKGVVSDKTKIELGDDEERTGVYTLKFTVNNLTNVAQTYKPGTYVMTETLASDKKTVAEKACMLNDIAPQITVTGGSVNGNTVTVPAGESVEIEIIITLSEAEKKDIDQKFINGMYVEGFAYLEAVGETKVPLNIPFLAFYGDWEDAPLFDYSTYEIAEEAADPSIEEEDKIKATASESRALGVYNDNQYILPLGTYVYEMAEEETEIYPSLDKAAISVFDEYNHRTVYKLYAAYMGLLRGAKTMTATITNATTGEVIYTKTQYNIRKAYSGGGSGVGSPFLFDLDPIFWNMSNNTTYNVSLVGTLDGEGEKAQNPSRNSFDFQFTIDSQAPVITDYRIRFDPYTENKVTKYNIYMDVDVYDNQYAMDLMPCSLKYNRAEQESQLALLTEYPLPIYSSKGEATTVTFDVTNYYDKILAGEFYLAVEDYAMNQTSYKVEPAAALQFAQSVTLTVDDKLTLSQEETEVPTYNLTLRPNEAYRVNFPKNIAASAQSLTWKSTREGVAKAHENEIFAFGDDGDTTVIELINGVDVKQDNGSYVNYGDVIARINVTVEGEALPEPQPEKITFKYVFNGKTHLVNPNEGVLELNPNQSGVQLVPKVEPWYCEGLVYNWKTSNANIATVDNAGNIKPIKKGTVYITATAKGYDRITKTTQIKVGEDFYVNSYRLLEYYGGPEVIIPEDLNIMYLHEDCFKNDLNITKVVLPSTLMEIPDEAFKGCANLKEIVIPAECTQSGEYAFAGCTSLETITLLHPEDDVTKETSDAPGSFTAGRFAFQGCKNLKTINNPERLTTAYINAFQGCGFTELNLTGLRIAGKGVFQGCTKLTKVTTTEDTAIGEDMFRGCTALKEFTFKGTRLSAGAFMGCNNLNSFTFAGKALYGIGANAFSGCTKLTEITLPDGNYSLGATAFQGCSLTKVNLSPNTKLQKDAQTLFASCNSLNEFAIPNGSAYYTVVDGVLYSDNNKVLELVPTNRTEITLPSTVTQIADNALAGTKITSIDMTNITSIGKYAFANTKLASIDLANITEIPDGAFYGCTSLTQVSNAEGVKTIGAYAFMNTRNLWKGETVTFPELTALGAGAFQNTQITGFVASELKTIGASAFANTKLAGELNFFLVTSIGSSAFSNNYDLVKVTFGAVTEMGEGVFSCTESFNQPALQEVVFGEGTTTIGSGRTFVSLYDGEYLERTALTTVVIPDTVTEIAEETFARAINLTNVNLANVTKIGDKAFYDAKNLTIQANDLSKLEVVGKNAFAYTGKITRLELNAVKEIASGAFANTALEEITLPIVEKIAHGAFSGSKLETIEIPNTDDLMFDHSWWELNTHNGKVELYWGRRAEKIEDGAFAGILSLTELKVVGEGKFFVEDGVLYSKVANGYVLEQYPANKVGESYTVKAGTVRIGDYAFLNTQHLKSVVIPASVTSIGAYAFYHASATGVAVTDYTFQSVEAPMLEASYVVDKENNIWRDIEDDDYTNAYDLGLFYANFVGYVKDSIKTTDHSLTGKDFKLSVSYPINGVGYNTTIWNGYFSTKTETAYAADKTTNQTIEAIKAIPTATEVQAILSSGMTEDEQKAAVLAYSEKVQTARKLYNLVVDKKQMAFVTEGSKLYETEEAIRKAKKDLGIPAKLETLMIAESPVKTKYTDGETFDSTGMVIKAIFDDLSEIEVTDYTLDKTVLYAGDEEVVDITISYGGKTCILQVLVNLPQGGGDVPTDSSNSSGNASSDSVSNGEANESDGGNGLVIVLIIVGAVVVVGGAAAFVFLRKKKATKVETAEENSDEETEE